MTGVGLDFSSGRLKTLSRSSGMDGGLLKKRTVLTNRPKSHGSVKEEGGQLLRRSQRRTSSGLGCDSEVPSGSPRDGTCRN